MSRPRNREVGPSLAIAAILVAPPFICCRCSSVARYHGTVLPRHRGTVFLRYQYRRLWGLTVLFSTAIRVPQVPRFFGTVLVHCWHTVRNICILFRLKLQPSACLLSFTAKPHFYIYLFYVGLLYSAKKSSIGLGIVYTRWVTWRHYDSGWREIITTVLPSTAVFSTVLTVTQNQWYRATLRCSLKSPSNLRHLAIACVSNSSYISTVTALHYRMCVFI